MADGARRTVACLAPDPVAPSDPCSDEDFDVDARADDTATAAASWCRGQTTIGAVSATAAMTEEESTEELARLFPETVIDPFCGFYFGGRQE